MSSSLAKRDLGGLNLLSCGNTPKGGQASTIAQFRYYSVPIRNNPEKDKKI